MLERVPLLEKHLDDYADVVLPGTIERIRELIDSEKRLEPTAATALELLSTHVPLLRDLGIEAE